MQRKVQSLQELAGEFDAVVNCTGLGARWLCEDYFMAPIRGQVTRVSLSYLALFQSFIYELRE